MASTIKRVAKSDFASYHPGDDWYCTYFLQAAQGGLIKVGGTTLKPISRLRAYQLCCPVKLELIAIADGYHEIDAHAKFAEEREYGEWFRYEGELKSFLEALQFAPIIVREPRAKFARYYRQKPKYGEVLSDRRKVLRKSMDYVEGETDGLLYKQLLYRLENGEKRPESLTVQQATALARSLEWSLEQLNTALGTGY